jgi:hypothetical protein
MRPCRSFTGAPGIGTADLNAPATILRYALRQKPNDFNGAKSAKTGWSDGIVGPRKVIDVEVIAGREWQEIVSSDGVVCYVSRLAQRALAP